MKASGRSQCKPRDGGERIDIVDSRGCQCAQVGVALLVQESVNLTRVIGQVEAADVAFGRHP